MGPITICLLVLLAAAILSMGLSHNKGSGYGAIAMLISFVGAQLVTHTDVIWHIVPFFAVSFLVVLQWKNWVAYLIGGLYALRTVWVLVHGFTGVESQVFWNMNNEVFVLLQCLLGIYGGAQDGGFRNWVSRFNHSRDHADVVNLEKSRSRKGG